MAPASGDFDRFEPATPSRKSGGRSASRQLVRWTDQKLAYAFAEFRNAATRLRIDIKKPMDEAAKCIADFVSGDALAQQLVKRRKLYLDELAKEGGDVSASASVRKATPRKLKAFPKLELDEGEDALSPDLETSTSVVKRTPRSAASNSGVQVKQELQTATDSVSSQSDSEYTESPTKAKNKRIRSKKRSAQKKKKAQPEWSDSESEGEVVSDTGGVTTMIETASPASHLPSDSPPKRIKSEHVNHGDSSQQGSATSHIEDVFVDKHGTQTVQPNPYFGRGSMNHMSYSMNPPSHGLPHFNYGYDSNNITPEQLQTMPSEMLGMVDPVLQDDAGQMWSAREKVTMPGWFNGSLHPVFHTNMIGGSTHMGMSTTSSPHTFPATSHSESQSPEAVKSSPSPARKHKAQAMQNNSFSSIATSASTSTRNAIDYSSSHTGQDDQMRLSNMGEMGRWRSTSFTMFPDQPGSRLPAFGEFTEDMFQRDNSHDNASDRKKAGTGIPGLDLFDD